MNRLIIPFCVITLTLIPCMAMAMIVATSACDGGASWVGTNPKMLLAFKRIGTAQWQLCLYLAYFSGLIWAAQNKKLSGDSLFNAFGFISTTIILLIILHYFGVFIRAHWIWPDILIPAAYLAFFGAFFALWNNKIIWWGGLLVLLTAVILTGVRMEFIC